MCRFVPQLPTKLGLDQTEAWQVFAWVLWGSKQVSHHCCFPACELAGSWIAAGQEAEAGLTQGSLIWDIGFPRDSLTSCATMPTTTHP